LENFPDSSLNRRSTLPPNPAAISGLSRSFDLAFLRDLRESFATFAVKGFFRGIKTGPSPASLLRFAAVIYLSFRRRNHVRYLDRLQPLALLVMRLALGVIIVAHGYHNLFGGLRHHVDLVASLGLPRWSAYLSAISEFFGGLLVLLGLFTRVAAFAICIDLSVAIAEVNFHNGLLGNGGYEFPLALAALAFALIFFGGGPIAFDHIRVPGGGPKSR
jgi:putative oxidoreductase